MKTKTATLALFVLLTKWFVFVDAAVASDLLQQCDCTGDLSLPVGTPHTRTEIVLTAFFSFKDCDISRRTGSNTTYHLIPAALLAVEDINNSSDILKNFHVSLDIRDTQCDAALGEYHLIESIKHRTGVNVDPPDNSFNLAILGPGCNAVSQSIAAIAGRWLNIPQVSYGYNLPELANRREKFPSFFQTVRSLDLTTISALRLLSHFNWTHNIGVIYEISDLFDQVMELFVRLSSTTPSNVEFIHNETVIPITRFARVTVDSESGDTETFMTGVVQDKIRVIVGFVSERMASLLVCMTRNVTVPSDGFLFVFVGLLSEDWWRDDTFCQLESEEVESVIVVSGESIVLNSSIPLPSGNGRTIHDFKVDYSSRVSSWCPLRYNPPDSFAAATYDAVWSIAKALDNISDLLNVNDTDDYQYNSVIYEALRSSLYATDFAGVSGLVQFNEKGERIGIDIVLQIQNGTRVIAGKFKPDSNEIFAEKFQWFGVSDRPKDIPKIIEKSVPLYILIITMVFTLAGMAFACAMCCFNWCYAKHKIIIASSQKLNYIIIAGVFFAYTTIVMLAILESPLGQLMNDELFKAVCIIRIWILPLSFTLSYGTMFAKAWRIYRIFNDPWASKRPLKDYHLMLIVLGLGLVDIMYLLPWTIIDPYRRFPSLGETNYTEFSRCSFFSCSSDMLIVWLGILTVYKILVMLAGVIVISLVQKNVGQKKYFNDAKSIAGAVYITALSFLLGGVLLQLFFTFRQEIILNYVASATWVNISSSGTLISVFIPKVYSICIKHEKGKKYKTPQTIFYLQHPDISRPIGESVGSLSVGSLTELNNTNQTVVCDITKEDITTITGTE